MLVPRRFVLPLLRAALAAAWVLLFRRRFHRLAFQALDFFRLFWHYGREFDKRAWRLAYCRRCPVYDAARQTCGRATFSPAGWYRSPIAHRSEPWGCWCFLPVKAATRCNCWLYDRTDGAEGWPHNLNSYPL